MPDSRSASSQSGPDEQTALTDLLALTPAGDRARLAGIAAARPMMAARGTQLAREAYRAQAGFGADDPRAAALSLLAARQSVRIARVDTELTRAQVTTPASSPDNTLIWGRVSKDGQPVAAVTVSARGPKGEVLGYGCTDAVGGFSMTVPGQASAQLRVTDAKGAVLYAGQEALPIAPGDLYYRDISIGAAPIDICQRPPDDPGGGNQADSVRVPNIVGRSEAEGVRLLAAVGLKPGNRTTEPTAGQVGLVLRQTPKADAMVPPGSEIAIVVSVSNKKTVPKLVGLSLEDARTVLEKASIPVAGMEFAVDANRQGIVLRQAPDAGAALDEGAGVKLVVGRAATPPPPHFILDLVALDARFEPVRLTGEELSARATQLGLDSREKLAGLAAAPDAEVRDKFALPALRDAQALKRVLRDMLAATA